MQILRTFVIVALTIIGIASNVQAETLRLAHASSSGSLIQEAVNLFAKAVKDKSGGDLTIQIFPDGQLGDEDSIAEGVGVGSIDIGLGGSVDAIDSRLNVTSLPFLFANNKAVHDFLDGPVGAELMGFGQDKGYILLGALDSGFRQFASTKAITSPEDLKGLKIRTPPNPVILATMRQLGALAESIPFGQVYTSLQAHVVSAVEPEIRDYYDSKWYEVADKLSIANYIWTANWWFMNNERLKSLTAEQQTAIKEAANETVTWYRGQLEKKYASILDDLKTRGIEINEINPDPFRQLVAPVYDEFDAEWGKELIAKVRKASSK